MSKSAVAKLVLVLRIVLGSVFILGGVAKLFAPDQAADLLSWMISMSGQTSKLLVVLGSIGEIMIGGAMVVRTKYLPVAALLSSAILLGFTFVGLAALQNPMPCGCFGNVLEFKTDEYFVARNIILLVVSLFVFRDATKSIDNAKE